MRRSLLILIYCLLCHSLTSLAQDPLNWAHYIKNGTPAARNHPNETGFYLISTTSGVKRSSLYKSGVNIIRNLDNQFFIVFFQKEALKNFPGQLINQFWPVNDLWKFSGNPDILESENLFLFNVRVLDEKEFIKNHSRSVKPVKVAENTFQMNASGQYLRKIIGNKNVLYAGIAASKPFEEAAVIDYNFTVNAINFLNQKYPSLRGQGFTVSVKENQYNYQDLDLKKRHIESGIGAEQISGHATDMAVLIAGGGNTAVKATGVASEATITSSDFNNLFPDPEEIYEQFNISLQNHSYGVAINNEYTAEARAYDQLIYENGKLIHIFSSGNSGLGMDPTGPYSGVSNFANLTGGFKMAKNIITVGAVDSLLIPEQLVSRGPAHDGRIKPELVAYSQTGSSGAAALVSGTALLLQQFFKNKYGELPPSALIKAVLVNSADDVGPAGIDFIAGFGNLNARHAIKAIEEERFYNGSVSQGEEVIFNINIPANVKKIKVTLTWNDPPAPVNSSHALINDLDLQVQSESNSFLPWVLNPYPHADSLTKPAQRGEDHLNNIEHVSVNDPEEGLYTVNVKGFDVPEGVQDFYVTYQLEFNEDFTWTYPVAGDNLPFDGERVQYLRWNSTYEDTGTLYYELNKSGNWNMVNNQISLRKSYYYWSTPEIFSSARVKMVIGNEEYISDEFVISTPLKVEVGFNCEDSVMFEWKYLPNAISYALFRIEDDELVHFMTTTDTTVILQKEELPLSLFAVAPKFENGFNGFRSLTYNYNLQGVECYISSFIVNETEEKEVELSLSLGTTYFVEEIAFEKEGDGGFKKISIIRPENRTTYAFTDTILHDGINTYRARVTFSNGNSIITESYSIFLLYERPYFLYPNPVNARDEYLVLHLKEHELGESIFLLYDQRGQLVYREALVSERSYLDLVEMNEGFYFYHLLGPDLSAKGKLIITR